MEVGLALAAFGGMLHILACEEEASLVGLAVGSLVEAVLAHSDQLVGRQALQVGGDAVDPGLDLLRAQRGGALVARLIHQVPCCNSTPELLSGTTASNPTVQQGEIRPAN